MGSASPTPPPPMPPVITPEKASWKKKLGIGCGGLFALFVLLGIVGLLTSRHSTTDTSTSSTPSAPAPAAKAPPPKPIPVQANLRDINQAYEENPVAADQVWENKLVQVEGVVADISRGAFGGTNIEFRGGGTVYFRSDQQNRVAQVRKGQKISVIGKAGGLMGKATIRDAVFAD